MAEQQKTTGPDRRQFLTAALGVGLASVASAAVPLAPPDKEPPNLPVPRPPHKKVGFAVVGLGELALGQILPAFADCAWAAPVAVVSGHRDKAEKTAAHYGIDPKNIYSYDDYDRIKDNPAIDVVYNVLPNSLHKEYTVRAFQAGKHVLCEKPMAPTVADCQAMIDAGKAAGKKLMIAYRLHYEPYNKTAIAMARAKYVGDVRAFTSENLQNTTAPNIRLSKATAGGPLGDVGVYCLNAARYMVQEEPAEAFGTSYNDPGDDRFAEVPARVQFTLRFPSGAIAQCLCGFDSSPSSWFKLTGTKGSVTLDPAFPYHGQRFFVEPNELSPALAAAGVKGARERQQLGITPKDHFTAEMDHFAECVAADKEPTTPGEEGLADAKVIAAIERSIAEGRWVKV